MSAIALFRERRFDEALSAARAVCVQFPAALDAWNIRGASARALGHMEEAETCFRQLETLNPAFAGAPYNLGLTLENQGRAEEAVAAYRRALDIDPQLAQAHNNLGVLLTGQRHLEAAIDHLEQACGLEPHLPEVHTSLGNALKRAARFSDAVMAYEAALDVAPGNYRALFNLGVLHQERGEAIRAVRAFEQALESEPSSAVARSHLVSQLAKHCDWDNLARHCDTIADLGVTTQGIPPFSLLALEDSPVRQLARSRNWAKRCFAGPKVAHAATPRKNPGTLRIGYFSGDFHDHPSMHLMAGLLSSHDRTRFEVHAFSYGQQREDDYRRKARSCVDHFHDVAHQSDEAIIALARNIGLDIAIDHKGYTAGTRNHLLQHRLAPVQINYLAYPGTLGADFIDYIVADRIVVPEQHRRHVSENVIFLPHTYQPTDSARIIADTKTDRAAHSLPEDAFVLCCFNATYKITAREFDVWMRVMHQIKVCVLWLFASNSLAVANLRTEAKRRGVDPNRLIFAQRLPNAQHLERQGHADLFVDTFAYNAHTTANDALWAGLPVVTRQGDQFAARVASSLLHAVELPELVTLSDADYERLIIELATNPARLSSIRAKLARNLKSAPLFDTALYTRHFEAGLKLAHERYRTGLPPADILVPP